jgi:hypothetical protein
VSSVKEELARILERSTGSLRYRVAWAQLAHTTGRIISMELFDAAVSELIEDGCVRRMRAQPEAPLAWIKSTDPGAETSRPPIPPATSVGSGEVELMSPVHGWLANEFIAPFLDGGARPVFVRDTSRSGPSGSGYWSRPDFTVALVRQYRFASERRVELHGFELKKSGSANISSVHEALAHTRWVHYSHLVWHTPDRSSVASATEEIASHCSHHGVGFITFMDPADVASYETRVSPQRKFPEPEKVDQYIETRFELPEIDALEKAVRGRL